VVSALANRLPACIRSGAVDTDGEESARKVSLCTTVYIMCHELMISGREGSFSRNTWGEEG